MKGVIFLALIVIPVISLKSQEKIDKKKIYTAQIELVSKSSSTLKRRVLYEVRDSSILVSSYKVNKWMDYSKLDEYNYSDIEFISIGKKNRVSRGLLYGALAGVALGSIIGLSLGDDPPGWFLFTAEEKALIGVMLGGLGGGISGAGIGSLITIDIPIHGKFENFNKNKPKLQQRSYKK